MRPPLLFSFLLFFTAGQTQTQALPTWFTEAFKSKGLDKRYSINPFLKPSVLQADFNGDGSPDVAVLVMEKGSGKKGILLVHGQSNSHYLFGGGTAFGSGSDNFTWADKWSLYKKKTAVETKFNQESGDIIGRGEIKLARLAILVEDYEDRATLAGGIIYWNGKKYIWIHQGE